MTAEATGRVTFWVPDWYEPGTVHPRMEVPAKALGAEVRRLDDGCDSGPGDIAVFPRPLFAEIGVSAETEFLAAKARGARCYIDLDDCWIGGGYREYELLRPWEIGEYVVEELLERGREIEAAFQQSFVARLEQADGLIVATPALRRLYAPFNANIHVCPNQIDPDDWRDPTERNGSPFRIGYAGSRSHIGDVWLIAEALEWAGQQPDVEIAFMGVDPDRYLPAATVKRMFAISQQHPRPYSHGLTRQPPVIFEPMREHHRRWDRVQYTVTPWTNALDDYRRDLYTLDVGLCPIDENAVEPWGRYRGDLKPLEYAMAGALPICSRATAYDRWEWRTPAATTPEEFTDAVRWAVTHRDEVRERATAVRRYVLAERTIEANASLWRAALDLTPVAVAA